MLRYMICPIVGTGTIDDPFREAVANVSNVVSAAIIPTHTGGPNIGKPKYNFAMCLCDTAIVSILEQVSNSYVFPDYNLDGRMDGMESTARNGMVQSVQAFVLNSEGLHFDASNDDGDSYRSLITNLGKQLEPAFSVNSLNVGSVAA